MVRSSRSVQFTIVPLTWEEIFPVWSKRCWPTRISAITTHSSMVFLGGTDMTVKRYPVSFFGTKRDDGYIFSVIGGHRSTDELYRHRSFYIDPPYRDGRLAQALLQRLEDQAKSEGCTALWGYPRPTIMPSYDRFGMKQVSRWLPVGENGVPNCYAIKYFEDHISTTDAALSLPLGKSGDWFSSSMSEQAYAQYQ